MPEIYEYRGVSDLVCAEVTKDDSTGITFGAVEPICGVAEIGRSSSSTSEAHYYDNIPACTVVTDGVDTITLQLSAIPLPDPRAQRQRQQRICQVPPPAPGQLRQCHPGHWVLQSE